MDLVSARSDAVRAARRATKNLALARARRDETIAAAVLDHDIPIREIARDTGVDLKQVHRIVSRAREA